ncbi:MAG: hypothetical protein K0S07_1747 [Chlamydiales bacterium]|jgi:hypothetical protein|nr:hypothetical protein [Chlamydiales bacterium]
MQDLNLPYQLTEASFHTFLNALGDSSKRQMQVVQSGGWFSLRVAAKTSGLGRFLTYFYKEPSKRAENVAETAARLLQNNHQYFQADEARQKWLLNKECLIQTAYRFKKHAKLQQVIQEIISSVDQSLEEQRQTHLKDISKAAKREEKAHIRQLIQESKEQIQSLRQEISDLEEALSQDGTLKAGLLSKALEIRGQEAAAILQLQDRAAHPNARLLEAQENQAAVAKEKSTRELKLCQTQQQIESLQRQIQAGRERIYALQQEIHMLGKGIARTDQRILQEALRLMGIKQMRVFIDIDPLKRLKKARYRFDVLIQGKEGSICSHTSLLKGVRFFNNFYRDKQRKGGGAEAFDLSEFSLKALESYHNYRLGGALPQPDGNTEFLELAGYIGDTKLQKQLEQSLLPYISLENALVFAPENGFPTLQRKALQLTGQNLPTLIHLKKPLSKEALALLLKEHYIQCQNEEELFNLLVQFAIQQLGGENSSLTQAITWLNTPISNQDPTTWLDFFSFSTLSSSHFKELIPDLIHRKRSALQKAPRLFYIENGGSDQEGQFNVDFHLTPVAGEPLQESKLEFPIYGSWKGELIQFAIRPTGKDQFSLFLKSSKAVLQNKMRFKIALECYSSCQDKTHYRDCSLSEADALNEEVPLASWPRNEGAFKNIKKWDSYQVRIQLIERGGTF